MNKLYFSIIFVLLFTNLSFSQSYFPINTGNKFIYNVNYQNYWHGGGNSGSFKSTMKINNFTIINNKKYYLFDNFPYLENKLIRYDSISGSLLSFDSSNSCQYYYFENLIDSLMLDSVMAIENSCSGRKLIEKGIDTLFGIINNYKLYDKTILLSYDRRKYDAFFGLIRITSYSSNGGSSSSYYNWQLCGCVINGIVYGDTSTTNIKIFNSEIPDAYLLLQNYPNPFNPSTNIKYQITNSKLVILKIYNILGKEIETLVNEKQSPGTYEVIWNAGDYPSGVYFYKLTAGDFTETKKMVLLK